MTDVGLLHRLRSATATRAVELLGANCPGAPDEAVAERLFDADADAAAAFSRVLLDLAGLADRLCPGVAVEDGVEEF